jgi:hypothetical protein
MAARTTEAGERGGVLQRVSRIGVEEPSSVGAELLDGDLRGRRTHCDRLGGDRLTVGGHVRLDQLRLRRGCEGLNNSLRDQHDGQHEREGEQDVEDRTAQVHPEVPQPVGRAAGEAADEGDDDRDPHSSRDEVLDCQPQHLSDVLEGVLTSV